MTTQAREKVETFGWEHAVALMMVGAAVARRAWPSDCRLFSSHRGTADPANPQWRMEAAGITFRRDIDYACLKAEDWYLVGTRPESESEALSPFPDALEISRHDVRVLTRDLAIAELRQNKAMNDLEKAMEERDKALEERDKAIAERDKAIAERDKAVGRAFSLEDVIKVSRAKLARAQESLEGYAEERRKKMSTMTLEDIMRRRWK